jgi:hypothetical protein
MSESTLESRLTKRELMDIIEGLVAESRIAKAKLWNPYDRIVNDNAYKAKISARSEGYGPPDLIPEIPLKDVSFVKRRAWNLESSGSGEVTEEAYQKERERRRADYVKWGATQLKSFAAGNCSIFASVTLGLLATQEALEKLAAADMVVEQFNFSSADGHAFLVVNRTGGRTNDSGRLIDASSWGSGAFVVDAWYARQRQTSPGSRAVKDVTDTASPYYDEDFMTFLRNESFLTPTSFTYKFLADLPRQ